MRRPLRLCTTFLVALVASLLGGVLAQDDELVIAYQGGAVTMDPHMRQETTTIAWQWHIYENLVRLNREGQLAPELAVSWESTGDMTWTFELREGVKWHDGSDFSAEDVVYSLERAKSNPNSQMGQFLTNVESVEATGPSSIEITTVTPDPFVPLNLSQVRIVNQAYAEEVGDEGMVTRPMGTGPYMATSFLTEDNLVLEAFPDYWGEQPDFARVRLVNIPSGSTRVAALLSGEVDVAEKVLPQDFARVEADPDTYITQAPSTRVIYLAMDYGCETNCPGSNLEGGKNPFLDPKVRQAVAHAIDVDTIIERVMGGAGAPASQYVAPADFGFDPELERYPYDPERARELLAEAGYPDGFSIRLEAPNDRYLNDALVAQAIAGMLGEVGIEVTVNAVPKAVFFPALDNREFVMFLAGWGSPDVNATLKAIVHTKDDEAGYGTLNRPRYSNPDVDRMIEEAAVEFDDEVRAEIIHQINEQSLKEDVLWVPLYTESVIAGVREGIEFSANPQEYLLAWEMNRE